MKTTSPHRRFHASVAIVSLLAAFAVASAARAEDKAAILLPGSANDQSWNALGYSILKSLEPHGFKNRLFGKRFGRGRGRSHARLREPGLIKS